MADLLLRNAHTIITMDDHNTDWTDADLHLRDGVIVGIGQGLPAINKTLNCVGCVVTPGLVNTHHHLYQTLTRAVPGAQNAALFGWLKELYPIWGRFTPDHMRISALTGLAELALSGCTMSSDHLYLYPNDSRLDDTIEAAHEIGLRFHPTRGSMSIGQSAGGLPPDNLVEDEHAIINDSIRVIDTFHDPSPASMLRVGLAPCSPFSVSQELMRDTAALARDKGVMLHTHLAENDEDIAYGLHMFGQHPGDYAETLGWTGPDVWHAHGVKLNADEIALFARTNTGVAHCPCSNARLGSGIAPVAAMMRAGVKVGLGVDGSASNDAGNMMEETRMAMLLQRLDLGADAMTPRDALRLATHGGAAVLGRGAECGQLTPGYRADIAVWDVTGVDSAGSWDPAALVLAGPRRVKHLIVDGRIIVADGHLCTIDLPLVVERQNQMARALALTQ